MAFTNISDEELVNLGVSGLPDTPELSTEDMQAQFDEYPQFLKDKFKTHIAELEANTAAADIGMEIPTSLSNVSDEKLQPIVDEIAARVQSQQNWQDQAEQNLEVNEINTAAFHADNETVTAPTADTADVSDKVATTEFVNNKMQAIGAGDMAKSVYDPNDRGVVESAYKVGESYVESITESQEDYPVPAQNDKIKVVIGKIIKYLNDIRTKVATQLTDGVMAKEDKIKLDNITKDAQAPDYGSCTTAGSTAAKVITVSNTDFKLKTGVVIGVDFSNVNTAQSPTFNVNNTGAKGVMFKKNVIAGSNISYAGNTANTMLYMYNGTYWVYVGDVDPVYDTALSSTSTNAVQNKKINEVFTDIVNVYGAKNLLPNNATSQTVEGVTFTVNSDGTVTANGTATAHIYAPVFVENWKLQTGSYILSGCPKGGSGSTYRLQAYDNSSGSYVLKAQDVGDSNAFTLSIVGNLLVRIAIANGVTVSNLTFKPMIRLASIQDDTYVPYAKTNKELTDTFTNQVANKDDEYSSSKAYKVGEHCIYNNVLYKCITACSAAAWSVNKSCFESTTLTSAVTDLNNDLNAQHRRKRGTFTPSGLRQCITSNGVDLSIMGYSIGDEYQINANYKAVIADIDTFYGGYDSDAVVSSHHVGLLIVGKAGTITSKWNNSDSTASGYNGSVLHTTLKGLISTIEGALGTLISHQKLLTTATSNWAWQASQKISALSECQIYGAPIWSIDGYQQGEAWKQLEVFRKFSFNEIFGNQTVWLRSARSASTACCAVSTGNAINAATSSAAGVVGLVLFH